MSDASTRPSDSEFDALLREKLPAHSAPTSLRDSLEARYGKLEPANPARVRRSLVPLAIVSAVAIAAIAASLFVHAPKSDAIASPLVSEAVNDHLRILYADKPVEIASGGIHQVKPWFEGRVDFAPVEPFEGDEMFPLQGGSVAYYIDRKAAAFVFKRRLHVITLFVFRADGLAFPPDASAVETIPVETHGFHVFLWRKSDLGYALVSDLDPNELRILEKKIRGE